MTITAKDVAGYLHIHGDSNGAALVRALEAVRVAALRFVRCEPDRLSYEADLKALGEALSAVDRLMKGTK